MAIFNCYVSSPEDTVLCCSPTQMQCFRRAAFIVATPENPDQLHWGKPFVIAIHKPINVGLSENSVSLNPMVFMIIIPIKWL